jgi:hypothetical protein
VNPPASLPTPRRVLVAFLVAPLVGAFFCLLLMSFLDIPRGAQKAPLYPLLVYSIFFAPAMYLATWVIGLLTCLILRRLGRLRPGYVVGVFTVAAAAIIVAIVLSPRSGRVLWEWLLIYPLTGAAIGGVVEAYLFPPGRRSGSS